MNETNKEFFKSIDMLADGWPMAQDFQKDEKIDGCGFFDDIKLAYHLDDVPKKYVVAGLVVLGALTLATASLVVYGAYKTFKD